MNEGLKESRKRQKTKAQLKRTKNKQTNKHQNETSICHLITKRSKLNAHVIISERTHVPGKRSALVSNSRSSDSSCFRSDVM